MAKITRADAFDSLLEGLAEEHGIDRNPVPGEKWQAKAGVPRMRKLCGSVQSLMACLIDLTHDEWGFCFPSRKYLQLWTGRTRWAIDRALAKAKGLGLVRTIERRIDYDLSDSTIVIVNWTPFFAAFQRVENLRGAKTLQQKNETETTGAKTRMAGAKTRNVTLYLFPLKVLPIVRLAAHS
jgi:hypothetical protein